MKAFPTGLDQLLYTGTYVFCDLYQFDLDDGSTVLYYTTADTEVLYNSNTYVSKNMGFDDIQSRATAHWKRGLDVSSWTVKIAPAKQDPVTGAPYPAQINGQSFLAAVANNVLDGAEVTVSRAYWAAWPQPWSTPLVPTYVLESIFSGLVADIDVDRSAVLVTINSWLAMFLRPMPRNIYSAGCRHTLFDEGCTLNKNSFKATGTVTTVTSNGKFKTDLSAVQGVYSLGYVVWTSGNNANYSRTVRSYAGVGGGGGECVLIAPMPFAVQPGDTFTIYQGCDKQRTTCTTKFNNLANFGGEPYIPAPEVAI